MSKTMKWVAIVAGGIVGLVVIAIGSVYVISASRLSRTFDIAPESVEVPEDSASIANGDRLATMFGCRECHGSDLGGEMLIDAAAFARVAALNVTSGRGGLGSMYTAADFERAIRHGVGSDRRALVIMPSLEYNEITDDDLSDLIAYLRQIPPVDREWAERSFCSC